MYNINILHFFSGTDVACNRNQSEHPAFYASMQGVHFLNPIIQRGFVYLLGYIYPVYGFQ